MTLAVSAADWPQWQGVNRTAISADTGLLKSWPKDGPPLAWKVKDLGGGYSTPSVTAGRIFGMSYRGDDEGVWALNEADGKELWWSRIASKGRAGYNDGPRCTPTVDGDRVYTLTRQGLLACLKINDGSILWHKDFKKEFGGRMMSGWDYSESPTIDGDKLICTPGGKDAAMLALNKLTGDIYWKCQAPVNSGAGYASIVIANVADVRQYITLMGPELGLIGVEAETGRFLWNYRKIANGTANIPTAIVKDDLVFTSTGYGTGAALLKLVPDGEGGIKAVEQYFLKGKQLQNHHGGVVMLGDYVYGGHGHNQGAPFCLEWKTGRFVWGPERDPGLGSAAVLYADGHLYFRYERGEMALIEATPKGYNKKSSFRVPIAGNGWPHPVIYHGRLYLRGADQILCYDIKQ